MLRTGLKRMPSGGGKLFAMPPAIPQYDDGLWPTLSAVRELGGLGSIDEIVERALKAEGCSEDQQAVVHDDGPQTEFRVSPRPCARPLRRPDRDRVVLGQERRVVLGQEQCRRDRRLLTGLRGPGRGGIPVAGRDGELAAARSPRPGCNSAERGVVRWPVMDHPSRRAPAARRARPPEGAG